MFQRTLGSPYELELDLAPALWSIEIDPTGLETALLNGLLNARDAMPSGGKIIVSTRNVIDQECEMVSLSIRDTGSGIPDEVIARVFEPFFTTKPTGKGTGLGLSQIHGFALQSGGYARIQSEQGRGTQLELLLPRTDKQPRREALDASCTITDLHLRVLLVEDSEHVRYFASHLLEDLGCWVAQAADAQKALALLERQEFDLVFSDIVMPGMNGLDMACQIRTQHPSLPVLLASGYSSKQFIPWTSACFRSCVSPTRSRHSPAASTS